MSKSRLGTRRNLIKLAQAADRLDVAPRTVRRMISRGELTGYRIGDTTMLRVDEHEVDECLKIIPTAASESAVK